VRFCAGGNFALPACGWIARRPYRGLKSQAPLCVGPIGCGTRGPPLAVLVSSRAGPVTVTLTGDESLSVRPMLRVIAASMGALFDTGEAARCPSPSAALPP
jgi:5-enolpyruvylshikimate-3-phosphate synthase